MITTINRPGGLVRALMPSMEEKQQEYNGAIYSLSALGHMVTIMTTDALDAMEERMPEALKNRTIRKNVRMLTGSTDRAGELALLRVRMNNLLVRSTDRPWMADFGNAVYGIMEGDANKLKIASANFLGLYADKIGDPMTVAMLVNAMWLAVQSAETCEADAQLLRDFTITRYKGGRVNASSVIMDLSCKNIAYHLREIAAAILGPIEVDREMLAVVSIQTGQRAFANKIQADSTWVRAIEIADERKNN